MAHVQAVNGLQVCGIGRKTGEHTKNSSSVGQKESGERSQTRAV